MFTQLNPFLVERHELLTALTPQECYDRLKALQSKFRIAEHPQSREIIRRHITNRWAPFAMSTSARCWCETRSDATHVFIDISAERNSRRHVLFNAFTAAFFPILMVVIIMLSPNRQQAWILLIAAIATAVSYRQYVKSRRTNRSDSRMLLKTVMSTLEAKEIEASQTVAYEL